MRNATAFRMEIRKKRNNNATLIFYGGISIIVKKNIHPKKFPQPRHKRYYKLFACDP
jgi:hypothetical protein